MRKIFINTIVIISCLIMVMVSCREDSDNINSYAYEDFLIFAEANSSLEGQFKAIWTAMNCNYPIWDYEEQQGLNWDDVYDKYLPRFKKLDTEYNLQKPVPDSLVSELYDSIFAPLHDGHLFMYLKNIHTGKKIKKSISPQVIRVVKNSSGIIELYYLVTSFKPTLKYYDDNEELKEFAQEKEYIFACFKDGIVYFRLPIFNLTQTFEERSLDESKERIYKIWESWFNCIKNLHASNYLKGVIIDVRNNTGGSSYDYQHVLGALHNGDSEFSGQHHKIGYLREKSGVGRLDFSRLQPFTLPVGKEHISIEVPIVILANDISASMAEITCLSAKQLKNGYVIGTKTYGAFSPSVDNYYAITYAGNVGDPSLAESEEKISYFAPFFIDIPTSAFLSLDNQFVDGAGVEPDEIVPLNHLEHRFLGKDNQLDKALEYIRSTKLN